jgi:hypothetical protein
MQSASTVRPVSGESICKDVRKRCRTRAADKVRAYVQMADTTLRRVSGAVWPVSSNLAVDALSRPNSTRRRALVADGPANTKDFDRERLARRLAGLTSDTVACRASVARRPTTQQVGEWAEPPWVRWRLPTLETRMESSHRRCRLGRRRHVGIARRRRNARCGWSASCARSSVRITAQKVNSRGSARHHVRLVAVADDAPQPQFAVWMRRGKPASLFTPSNMLARTRRS